MPTWTEFFVELSDRIDVQSSSGESILEKLVTQFGGEVQRSIERAEHFPLYIHDVVAPLVMRGTDISTAAVRDALA